MKLIRLFLLLYVMPLHAQDKCDDKLYVDSLRGFSIEIPHKQKMEPFSKYREYNVSEDDYIRYKIYVETRRNFIDDILRLTGGKLNVGSDDSLLAAAKINCKISLASKGDRAESYGRLDSLNQWINENDVRIIEMQRTQVFEVFDGYIEYGKGGSLYFALINNSKGEFVLYFDFYNYYEYEVIKKVISSVKVI